MQKTTYRPVKIPCGVEGFEACADKYPHERDSMQREKNH